MTAQSELARKTSLPRGAERGPKSKSRLVPASGPHSRPAGHPGATLRLRSSRFPLSLSSEPWTSAEPACPPPGLDLRPRRPWPRPGSGRCAGGRGKIRGAAAGPARRQPGEERDSSGPEVRLRGQPRASMPVAGALHGLAELVCVCVVRRAPRTEEKESRDTTRGPRAGPPRPGDPPGKRKRARRGPRPLASLVSREEAPQTAGSPTRREGRGHRRRHSRGSRRARGPWYPGQTWRRHGVLLGLPEAPQRFPPESQVLRRVGLEE